LVVADDLAIGDLGAYGAKLIKTPNVDKLAATGLLCTEMYAAASTDTPSRAGILTGRYGARYNLPATLTKTSTAGLPQRATTIARLLRDQGYATGLFGQWRLGSRAGQLPNEHGFERFRGTLFGADVSPVEWYEDATLVETGYDSAFAAREITEEAVKFIGEHPDKPVFAVLSHLAPHVPYRAESEFFGKSEAGLYGDVVQQLDHYFGVLMRELRKQRGHQRTLVIFTSDNGPRYEGFVQNRRGRKPELFDGGVRVPFAASWLTACRPIRDSRPRSLLDLTPSLCALGGATAPSNLDGVDLSPLFFGRETPERGPVYLWQNQFLNAVRDGKWKLHVAQGSANMYGNSLYFPMLFDYDGDFREVFSVARNHPAIVDQMRTRLLALRAEVLAEAAS
jgi:uncharacterized sulfatase